jgi:hypothetical protein
MIDFCVHEAEVALAIDTFFVVRDPEGFSKNRREFLLRHLLSPKGL